MSRAIVDCRACKAPIVFLRTATPGRYQPCDAATVQDGDTLFDHTRHTSHFATCPAASRFRAPRGRDDT